MMAAARPHPSFGPTGRAAAALPTQDRGPSPGLCVLIIAPHERLGNETSRWKSAIASTWATDLTFFWDPHRDALEPARGAAARARAPSEAAPRPGSGGAAPPAPERLGEGRGAPWQRGLELWASAARQRELLGAAGCEWLLHADLRSYVNAPRLRQRLGCLRGQRPEYYALAPLANAEGVVLADEHGGYVLGARLLHGLAGAGAPWAGCRRRLLASGDALGFGWARPPGFYAALCLWLEHRLRPRRLADPAAEVLLPETGGAGGALARLRALQPAGHCVLALRCRSARCLAEAHRVVGDGANVLQVGCWVRSLAEPGALVPEWGARLARALLQCPLRAALRRQEANASFGALLAELRAPRRPRGPAAERLGGATTRRELCILLPATDATARQVQRAQAAAATWARPYLGAGARRVVAVLYSRRPLLPSWRDATLSLAGDVDMRHPKFNALRFLYLWWTLALHHARSCDFFMKADMDAYVNVEAVRRALRRFNASEAIYAGTVTLSHGPSYEKWETFAHGLGYILSRGALVSGAVALRNCLQQLVHFRLEAIEDMTLAACLRKAKIRPRDIGPVNFNFKGDVPSVAAAAARGEAPLMFHPVEPAEMLRLHGALAPAK